MQTVLTHIVLFKSYTVGNVPRKKLFFGNGKMANDLFPMHDGPMNDGAFMLRYG